MGTTTRHLQVCIEGVLNWSDKDLLGLFTGGTAQEIREYLREKITDGHRVLPFGKPCDGWDKVNGCPGHKTEEKELINQ